MFMFLNSTIKKSLHPVAILCDPFTNSNEQELLLVCNYSISVYKNTQSALGWVCNKRFHSRIIHVRQFRLNNWHCSYLVIFSFDNTLKLVKYCHELCKLAVVCSIQLGTRHFNSRTPGIFMECLCQHGLVILGSLDGNIQIYKFNYDKKAIGLNLLSKTNLNARILDLCVSHPEIKDQKMSLFISRTNHAENKLEYGIYEASYDDQYRQFELRKFSGIDDIEEIELFKLEPFKDKIGLLTNKGLFIDIHFDFAVINEDRLNKKIYIRLHGEILITQANDHTVEITNIIDSSNVTHIKCYDKILFSDSTQNNLIIATDRGVKLLTFNEKDSKFIKVDEIVANIVIEDAWYSKLGNNLVSVNKFGIESISCHKPLSVTVVESKRNELNNCSVPTSDSPGCKKRLSNIIDIHNTNRGPLKLDAYSIYANKKALKSNLLTFQTPYLLVVLYDDDTVELVEIIDSYDTSNVIKPLDIKGGKGIPLKGLKEQDLLQLQDGKMSFEFIDKKRIFLIAASFVNTALRLYKFIKQGEILLGSVQSIPGREYIHSLALTDPIDQSCVISTIIILYSNGVCEIKPISIKEDKLLLDKEELQIDCKHAQGLLQKRLQNKVVLIIGENSFLTSLNPFFLQTVQVKFEDSVKEKDLNPLTCSYHTIENKENKNIVKFTSLIENYNPNIYKETIRCSYSDNLVAVVVQRSRSHFESIIINTEIGKIIVKMFGILVSIAKIKDRLIVFCNSKILSYCLKSNEKLELKIDNTVSSILKNNENQSTKLHAIKENTPIFLLQHNDQILIIYVTEKTVLLKDVMVGLRNNPHTKVTKFVLKNSVLFVIYEDGCIDVFGMYSRNRTLSILSRWEIPNFGMTCTLVVGFRSVVLGFQDGTIKMVMVANGPLKTIRERMKLVFCVNVKESVVSLSLEHATDSSQFRIIYVCSTGLIGELYFAKFTEDKTTRLKAVVRESIDYLSEHNRVNIFEENNRPRKTVNVLNWDYYEESRKESGIIRLENESLMQGFKF